MDPITAITTAIATGAAAAISPTAKQAVQDLYAGVKKLIQDKYHRANSSLEALEKKNRIGFQARIVTRRFTRHRRGKRC